MGQGRKRNGPTTLNLLSVYILSFFGTSLWLASHLDTRPRTSSKRDSIGISSRHINFLNQRGNKLLKPAVSAQDFVGLKLLSYGDSPYEYGPWDMSPVVLESQKLLFWTTPKVACTVFKKLFRRIQGYSDWMVENRTVPHRPETNGLHYLYHYQPVRADAMLTDPTWTRAIFVRDPKERLLSAYLDKVMSNHSYYIRHHCCHKPSLSNLLNCVQFRLAKTRMDMEKLPYPAVSFGSFLRHVYANCSDPHWKPQVLRMEAKYWKFINFVGHLENSQIDSEQLLRQIGVWDEYGASGWPAGSMFANNSAEHATFARHKMKFYYTAELETLAEQIHAMDYNHPLFNLTIRKYS